MHILSLALLFSFIYEDDCKVEQYKKIYYEYFGWFFFYHLGSSCVYLSACVCLSHCHVWLLATPWTVAMRILWNPLEFSRQANWSGLPFSFPGHLPNPGIKPWSPALQAEALPPELLGKPIVQWFSSTLAYVIEYNKTL